MMSFAAKTALLAATALGAPALASAAGLDQFIGFGDSTMDSGYFRYQVTGGSPGAGGAAAGPYLDKAIAATVAAGGSGDFAGPAVVDTKQLAAKFGLTALPSTFPGGGGTNYANGSAQTLSTTGGDGYTNGLYNNVPIVTQMYNYLDAVHGHANPNGLYMVSFGGNDLTWLTTQAPASLSQQAFIQSLANGLTTGVAALQAAGARTIVVLDVYAYARLVGPDGAMTKANAADIANATLYSTEVWSGLAAARVNFVPADVEGVLKYVSQNPVRFGFTPATELATSPACLSSSSMVCRPSDLITPNAEQTYLWSDDHHLSQAGQTIEADYIYSLMTAPSDISLLAESAVRAGLGVASTIQGQIDVSGQQRGPSGVNAWVSAGAGGLRLQNAAGFPNASGVPFSGSAGGDYLTPIGVLVGAAVSAGDEMLSFSSGGHFVQTDQALSLYAAARSGPVWGDAVASYGVLQNHVARQVTVGRLVDQDNGDGNGESLGLAVRGGYDLGVGRISTGPVVGLVLQQVRINGFTETGATGITALAFGDQTRNSAVTQVGWRGSVALGNWGPFAEVAWNHELGGQNRSVTASLTAIAAPSYSAAAAPVATDWASGSLGVTYKLTPQVVLRGVGLADVFSAQVCGYGAELGVNASF
jgi:outer membrane lipase/esterase